MGLLRVVKRQSPSEPWTRWQLRSRFPDSSSCRRTMSTTKSQPRLWTTPSYWKRLLSPVWLARPVQTLLSAGRSLRGVGDNLIRRVRCSNTKLIRNGRKPPRRASITKTITCRWPCRKMIRLILFDQTGEYRQRIAVRPQNDDKGEGFAGGFSFFSYWSPWPVLPSSPSPWSPSFAMVKVISSSSRSTYKFMLAFRISRGNSSPVGTGPLPSVVAHIKMINFQYKYIY